MASLSLQGLQDLYDSTMAQAGKIFIVLSSTIIIIIIILYCNPLIITSPSHTCPKVMTSFAFILDSLIVVTSPLLFFLLFMGQECILITTAIHILFYFTSFIPKATTVSTTKKLQQHQHVSLIHAITITKMRTS